MVIEDRTLQAHEYFYSEEWQGLRRWLPGHPAGRALVVGYRPAGNKITLQLFKHDWTKSIRQVMDADAAPGMTPSVMNDLIWYMSDTTGVDTPQEVLAAIRKRLIDDRKPGILIHLRAFKAAFRIDRDAEVRAVAARLARANGWRFDVFDDAVGFRWPRSRSEPSR